MARFAALFVVVVLGGVSAALAAAPGHQTRIERLRSSSTSLAARAHSAALDLYAIDEHLAHARTKLGSLESQAAELRSEQALLNEQLSVTRKNLVVSQRMLSENLRALYEQGQTDPLAIVFGAESLDEAVTKLDDLSHVAQESKRVVEVTTTAQKRVARLRAAIRAERSRIDDALASARATERELASTRASRASYVSVLRTKQRLASAQIASLETTVKKAVVKSQTLQPTVPATPGNSITVSSTGYSLPGHTASGLPVGWGIVAVDPSVIPLGTHMTVPGYGEAVAADVGSAVRGYDIDLWFPSYAQAAAWGRRTVTITLHG